MPVKFEPKLRKTHVETAHAVTSVLDSSVDLSDSADDMPISEDEIVEEAAY